MLISSLQNPSVKNIVKLSKNRERREQNIFLLEGARELSLAQGSGYEVESVYLFPDLFEKSKYPDVLVQIPQSQVFEITQQVFEKIAYRENSDGIIALMKPKLHRLSDLRLSDNPFVILLESVEKPGNLGAVLRTADAAAVDAVVICDPLTDLYNPNVIRSSVGGVFTVQTAVCTSDEALQWLKANGITNFAAELQAARFYQSVDFRPPSAIVMGTEADGLSSFWLQNSDNRIKIPMSGAVDSLNVSVSTAIITFEAMRQRRG